MYLVLLCLNLHAKSSFITPEEYSTQLYYSPRGIGCDNCHGDKGEGRVVANYADKKEIKNFSGPAINNISYEQFYRAMIKRKRGMPRYFLIDDEIKALYFYLHTEELNEK
ncbi:MAG: cytochrome c [Campylobacterota bacterium]|nr:cytochrome c [Campylobacterota bacterium]